MNKERVYSHTRNAGIASTGSNWVLGNDTSLLLLSKTGLWCNGLSGAVDNSAVLDKTLDHPVIIATTGNTIINASLAEIEVAIVTGAAVVVCIGGRNLAVIAVDRVDTDSLWSWGSWNNRVAGSSCMVAGQGGQSGKLSKPLVASGRSTGDWDITARAGIHSWGVLVMEHIWDVSVQLATASRAA